MNNEVFKKRITADRMRLEYRSALARSSGENIIFKILLAYSDIMESIASDSRTFKITPEQVIDYVSTMSGCMMQQMNIIRGVSDEEFINHMLDEMAKDIPEYIKDQFDEIPDEPIYYDEEDEDEE